MTRENKVETWQRGVEELPEVLTVKEAAALARVNRKAIYAMIESGELPGVRKFRRTIRISKRALLEWLAV